MHGHWPPGVIWLLLANVKKSWVQVGKTEDMRIRSCRRRLTTKAIQVKPD